jgi:hypothetical protein
MRSIDFVVVCPVKDVPTALSNHNNGPRKRTFQEPEQGWTHPRYDSAIGHARKFMIHRITHAHSKRNQRMKEKLCEILCFGFISAFGKHTP